jgi:hypothetical protein
MFTLLPSAVYSLICVCELDILPMYMCEQVSAVACVCGAVFVVTLIFVCACNTLLMYVCARLSVVAWVWFTCIFFRYSHICT